MIEFKVEEYNGKGVKFGVFDINVKMICENEEVWKELYDEFMNYLGMMMNDEKKISCYKIFGEGWSVKSKGYEKEMEMIYKE